MELTVFGTEQGEFSLDDTHLDYILQMVKQQGFNCWMPIGDGVQSTSEEGEVCIIRPTYSTPIKVAHLQREVMKRKELPYSVLDGIIESIHTMYDGPDGSVCEYGSWLLKIAGKLRRGETVILSSSLTTLPLCGLKKYVTFR